MKNQNTRKHHAISDDMLWSARRRITKFAEFISRKTSCLDGLKNRLGISNAILKILAPPVKQNEIVLIKKSLNPHYVDDRVSECLGKKLIPNFWIILTRSMGDIVACEPVSRHLKSIVPTAKVHWIVLKQFSEVLEANPFIDEVVAVDTMADGKEIASARAASDESCIIVDCHFDGTSDPATNRIFANPVNPKVNIHTYFSIGSLLATFSAAAGLPMLDDAPIFHFRKNIALPFTIKDNTVIFHCCSAEKCRNWNPTKWNQLAKRLTLNGTVVVEIGTERTLEQMPNVFDYTGRKSIQQIALIIKNAVMFVGVDSVFAHIANAVLTPSVILLGKYRNFNTYFPYSGDFSRSPSFHILRAPTNQPASEISVDEAFKATCTVKTCSGCNIPQ